MAFNAKGLSGEVLIGGRKAVKLGRWELNSVGGGFICEAAATETDDYLMQMPSPRVLRLSVGSKIWIWRNVTVGGAGDQLTISGSGRMKIEDRD